MYTFNIVYGKSIYSPKFIPIKSQEGNFQFRPQRLLLLFVCVRSAKVLFVR